MDEQKDRPFGSIFLVYVLGAVHLLPTIGYQIPPTLQLVLLGETLESVLIAESETRVASTCVAKGVLLHS